MYEEVWECPECGEKATFNRPRIHVTHDDCPGEFERPPRSVAMVRIEWVVSDD